MDEIEVLYNTIGRLNERIELQIALINHYAETIKALRSQIRELTTMADVDASNISIGDIDDDI